MSEIADRVDKINQKKSQLREIAKDLDDKVNGDLMSRDDAKVILAYHLDDLFSVETSVLSGCGFHVVDDGGKYSARMGIQSRSKMQPLNVSERKYIAVNYEHHTVREIAEELNRSPGLIAKEIAFICGVRN